MHYFVEALPEKKEIKMKDESIMAEGWEDEGWEDEEWEDEGQQFCWPLCE